MKVDAEKPDPNKPWCHECMGHTPFQKKEYRLEGGTAFSFYCKNCNGTKMDKPNKMALAKIIFNYVAAGAFLIGIGVTLFENNLTIFYWFGGLGFFSIFLSWWSNRRFSKWRDWAKEKGYTECSDPHSSS